MKKETENNSEKIKVLYYGDFLQSTGFGTVAMNIIDELQKTNKFEFEILAINYNGSPINSKDHRYYKFRNIPIHPAVDYMRGQIDMMGKQKLADMIQKANFDVLFIIQDSFNLLPYDQLIRDVKSLKGIKYLFYFPIDGNIRGQWVNSGMKTADEAVTYTQFGIDEISKHDKDFAKRVKAIPHGTDCSVFKPFEKKEDRKEFRKSYFNVSDDTFLITNINRNQPRKDMVRCIRMFDKFVKDNPKIKSKLYLHCRPNDHGINLPLFASEHCSEETLNKISFPPLELIEGDGLPVETVSKIYGASDLVISSTLGEGWGLAATEAMACGTPALMPKNTSQVEIIGENEERGFFINSGNTENLWISVLNDNNLLRPVIDIDHGAQQIKFIYNSKELREKKAKLALEWVNEKTWSSIAEQFGELLEDLGKKAKNNKHNIKIDQEKKYKKALKEGKGIDAFKAKVKK